MTEELENKLNEILGLKKQLEESTAEQRKATASSVLEQYKKEAKRARIRYLIGFIMSIVFMLFGAAGLGSTEIIIMGHDISGTPAQYALGGTFMLFGVYVISITVVTACIRQSKLQILAEMKHLELKITDMLKK
jgi:hypothetical protein